MFCPNCGHKVDLSQKFCDNCGYDLTSIKTKRTEEKNEAQKKDDDTIKSLADIEAELNDSEPVKSEPAPAAKPKYEQAPAQQHEYSSVKPAAEVEQKKPATKPAPNYDSVRTFDSTKKVPDEALEDRTVAYNKDAFRKAATQKPYSAPRTSNPTHSSQAQHESAALNTTQDFKNRLFKNGEDPFKPTKSELKKMKEQKKLEEQQNDTNDGLIHNMGKFLKNNAYLGIFAVIIVAILLVVKRNYGFIALAIVLLLWFLASQVSHGNEMNANKKFKHENNKTSNDQPQQHQETYREPKKQKVTDSSRGKNTRQKVIIGSSIIGFAASIGGPFINGVSLSSTIASAANYTANFGYQYSTLIVNLSSAIRLICFLSPVIALIAACFRKKGTIRLVRIFTVLPTVIYALVFGIFYSGAVNSAVITGQTAVGGTQFGASFYVLLVTSIVSLIMAYSLHPRARV